MWFGESFAIQKSYNIPFGFNDRVTSEPITVRASVATRAIQRSSSFTFTANSTQVFNISFANGITPGYANDFAIVGSGEGQVTVSGGTINIGVEFNNPSTADNGWLDYIEILAKSRLRYSGNTFAFRAQEELGESNVRFNIQSDFNVAAVWNVTNHQDVKEVVSLTSAAALNFVGEGGSQLDEYIIFNPSNASSPKLLGLVQNQDLHNAPQADYVILVHPNFLSQANDLANFHREEYGYEVYVATTNQVYNEFSGGNQDITAIKDFMKMLYDRAGLDDSKMPRYLLLFGDASYNYKSTAASNSNFIPSYQSLNSVKPTRSYVSDDYFGFLDDSESDALTSSLDIGIGRFPVRTSTEASNVVQKIKKYHEKPNVLQPWRGWLTFVGDDEDNRIHMRDSDDLAKRVQRQHPIYNLKQGLF